MVTERPSEKLPEYETPPVIEVVCGITFRPIHTFVAPHFGLLWQRFEQEYPEFQEVAPIIRQTEAGEPAQTEGQLVEIPQFPRVWYIDEAGNKLIQVQRDRFLHNWKKVKPGDQYPRYSNLIKVYQERLSEFERFLKDKYLILDTIQPEQLELTYINHIHQGQGWEDISEVGEVFPDVSWRRTLERPLPAVESITWRATFLLPNQGGRLIAAVRNAKLVSTGKQVLLFELTARRGTKAPARDQIWEWFDQAHVAIMLAFESLTSKKVQRDHWGLKS
jgi:uncharacterized protein (TIGR04255 family)